MTARINLIYLVFNIFDYLNSPDSKNIGAECLRNFIAWLQMSKAEELETLWSSSSLKLSWIPNNQSVAISSDKRTKRGQAGLQTQTWEEIAEVYERIGEKLEKWGRCKNENEIKQIFDLLTQYEAQWSFRKSCNVEMMLATWKLLITILIVSLNRMWYCDS